MDDKIPNKNVTELLQKIEELKRKKAHKERKLQKLKRIRDLKKVHTTDTSQISDKVVPHQIHKSKNSTTVLNSAETKNTFLEKDSIEKCIKNPILDTNETSVNCLQKCNSVQNDSCKASDDFVFKKPDVINVTMNNEDFLSKKHKSLLFNDKLNCIFEKPQNVEKLKTEEATLHNREVTENPVFIKPDPIIEKNHEDFMSKTNESFLNDKLSCAVKKLQPVKTLNAEETVNHSIIPENPNSFIEADVINTKLSNECFIAQKNESLLFNDKLNCVVQKPQPVENLNVVETVIQSREIIEDPITFINPDVINTKISNECCVSEMDKTLFFDDKLNSIVNETQRVEKLNTGEAVIHSREITEDFIKPNVIYTKMSNQCFISEKYESEFNELNLIAEKPLPVKSKNKESVICNEEIIKNPISYVDIKNEYGALPIKTEVISASTPNFNESEANHSPKENILSDTSNKSLHSSKSTSSDILNDSPNSNMSCLLSADLFITKYNERTDVNNHDDNLTSVKKIEYPLQAERVEPIDFNPKVSLNRSEQDNFGVFNFPKFSTPTEGNTQHYDNDDNMDDLIENPQEQKLPASVNDKPHVVRTIHKSSEMLKNDHSSNDRLHSQSNFILEKRLSSILDAHYESPKKMVCKDKISSSNNQRRYPQDISKSACKKRKLFADNGNSNIYVVNDTHLGDCHNFLSTFDSDVETNNISNRSYGELEVDEVNCNDLEFGKCNNTGLRDTNFDSDSDIKNASNFTVARNSNVDIPPQVIKTVDDLVTKVCEDASIFKHPSNIECEEASKCKPPIDIMEYEDASIFKHPSNIECEDASRCKPPSDIMEFKDASTCKPSSHIMEYETISEMEDVIDDMKTDSEILVIPETEGLELSFSKDTKAFLETSTLSESLKDFPVDENVLNMSSQSKLDSPVVNNIVAAITSSKASQNFDLENENQLLIEKDGEYNFCNKTPEKDFSKPNERVSSDASSAFDNSLDLHTPFLDDDTQDLGNAKQVPYLNEINVEERIITEESKPSTESNINFTCSLSGADDEAVMDVEIILFGNVKYAVLLHKTHIYAWRQESNKHWIKIFGHQVEDMLVLVKMCVTMDDDNLVVVMLLSNGGQYCLQFLIFEKDARDIMVMENVHWLKERWSDDSILLCGLDDLVFAVAQNKEGSEVSVHAFLSLREYPRLMTALLGSTRSPLHSLCKIDMLPNALLGIDESTVYIWHIQDTRLVTAVLLHPHDYIPIKECFWATVENGLVYFLTTCKGEDKHQVCQLLVANLATGYCESAKTYSTYPSDNKVKRIIKASYLEPFLVVSHANGAFIWTVTEEFCCASLCSKENTTAITVSKDFGNWGILGVGSKSGHVDCYSLC